jgi:hypothetical protein
VFSGLFGTYGDQIVDMSGVEVVVHSEFTHGSAQHRQRVTAQPNVDDDGVLHIVLPRCRRFEV